MSEEESAQIKAQNEDIRKERDKIVDEICMKFSCFKKDFLGAPIRKALKPLQAGAGIADNSFEIPYRLDEKYWVVSAKNEVTISFALQFDNQTDRALARIFLLVSSPPLIMSIGILGQQEICEEPTRHYVS